ncbi:HNH endonuclease [Peribacillus sp. NPDC060186]
MYEEMKGKPCGIPDERFLIASHIKPWSRLDIYERLDKNNGFLLFSQL